MQCNLCYKHHDKTPQQNEDKMEKKHKLATIFELTLFASLLAMALVWDMWREFAMLMIGMWANNISNRLE